MQTNLHFKDRIWFVFVIIAQCLRKIKKWEKGPFPYFFFCKKC